MKLLILLITFAFTNPPGILMIDIDLKKEIKTAEEFTIDDYFQKNFPVYAEDIQAVIDGAEKIAKSIDRNEQCEYSINANHTVIYLKKNCDTDQSFSVRFVTKLNEQKTYFDFELVRKEKDRRAAQKRLLDFAAYLSR